MKIGGLVKCSLVDFPGKLAAVIFTQGCNFRCLYCHNPHLVYPELFARPISWEYIKKFLEKRRGLLEGVVFCGGEPTIQEDLLERIQEVRSLGYAVKLDTNGSRALLLHSVLPYLDYVAMDIKAPLGPRYSYVCGVPVDLTEIRRSMEWIRRSGIAYEFRTTVHPDYMPMEEIESIRNLLTPGEKYILQHAQPFELPTDA
ncbi:MAG TPA: anaerobic ribonucleoside-triphosphate reductase activating protein [Thermoguttaceae bacterium]|nr:anaerobic ribonucleoside-triphosphate reductase activating protein [Thermoguttaceae bacterium]